MPASPGTRHASIPAAAVRHPTTPAAFLQVSRGVEGDRTGGARVPGRPSIRARALAEAPVGRFRTLAPLDPHFHPEG
ncbi:hypothetical protein WKI65_16695 [Streptomyces sp. MS1.AVA.3]|uniref:hypothetical protein n=1 Tax=Streptomyces decoyicus TaxID=249567 RepID=UPI0030BE5B65